MIDSEGNVIASDLTPEEIEQLMEVSLSDGTGNENNDQKTEQNTLEVSKGD